MFIYVLKLLQIIFLSIGLLSLNHPAQAQSSQTTKPSEAEITKMTFSVLNVERAKKKLAPVDSNNLDASLKDLSPKERYDFFTELDKTNVSVRKSLGLVAAEIPRMPVSAPKGISEIHDKFTENLIKSKVGLAADKPASQKPEFAASNVAGVSEVHDQVRAGTNNSSTQKSNEKLKLEAVDDKNGMLGSITMISIGFIASRLYKYKMTTDIMAAAAGGAAYIVGEVMSTNKFKDVSKELEIEIKKNKNDQSQIESLNKLVQSYEKALEAIETKIKFQEAAAVAFTGAAAIAFFMKGLEITAETATTTALTSASAAAAAASAAASATCPVTGAGCVLIVPCKTAATSFAAGLPYRQTLNRLRDEKIIPSMAGQTSDLAPRTAFSTQMTTLTIPCPIPVVLALPPIIRTEDFNQSAFNSYSPAPITASLNMKPFKFYTETPLPKLNPTYFEKLLNFLLPSAHANMMNLLMGGAGAGAGVLMGMVGTMGASIDTFMFAPKNRGIIWGVLAGLSLKASHDSEEQIYIIKENINKVDRILHGMNSLAKGVGTDANERGNTPKSKTTAQEKENMKLNLVSTSSAISSNPADKTACFGSDGSSDCQSLSNQLVKLPDYKSLPPQLQGLSLEAAKMGDGLSGTNKISGATAGLVGSFAAKKNAINSMLDLSKGNVNNLLAKSGKPPINFLKEEGGMLRGFNDISSKALRKNNMTSSGFLASFSPSLGGSLNDGSSSEAKNQEMAKSLPDQVMPVETIDIGAGGLSSDNFASTLNAEGEPSGLEKDSLAATLEAQKNIDDYEIGTSDINTDSKNSLFDLISARYVKSGYPRLFKKIEEVKVEK